jgi:gluconolactonase
VTAASDLVSDFELVLSGAILLEGLSTGPRGEVYVADVRGGGVRVVEPTGAIHEVVEHRRGIGGTAVHADGGLVVSGRNVAHKRADGSTVVVCPQSPERRLFNDFTIDPQGRIYVGSWTTDTPYGTDEHGRSGALVLIELDGNARTVDPDSIAPNGLGFSPDGRHLYAAETGRRMLWRYEPGAPDFLGSKTAFHDFGERRPDGMAVAEDGSVWVALIGSGCVTVLDADGARIADVPIPLANATNVCFGGEDRRTLFVSTGSPDPETPEGSLFRARAAVAGLDVALARVRTP